MQIDQLNALKTWFDTYSHSFLTDDKTVDGPHSLKIEHSFRVCENIISIGQAIGLTDRQLRMAEAIGLFHDIGRFEQYRRFGTFNDRKSVNHAALGVHVIQAAGILHDLPKEEQSIIIDAIRFHNAPFLPGNKSAETTLFMRLIRDADKLDIWRVFADYYRQGEMPEPAIIQHLADLPFCSPTIVEAILAKRMAKFQDMKSLNDFKLLQLSWVFDLHFAESLALAASHRDLHVIARTLPADPPVQQAVSVVMSQLATAAS